MYVILRATKFSSMFRQLNYPKNLLCQRPRRSRLGSISHAGPPVRDFGSPHRLRSAPHGEAQIAMEYLEAKTLKQRSPAAAWN
jgi:hypothetical protein